MKGITVVFVFLGLFLSQTVSSQSSDISEMQSADTNNYIPPLGVIIDSAILHSAMFRYYEKGATVKKYGLASEKISWTKNFGFQADVRYGTFDNFSTNTSEGQTPALLATKTTQTNYGVGAFVKLPISDILSHKSKVNLARTEVEQAETMAEVQLEQIRQIVIKQYNDLVMKQSLLKIKSRNLEISRTNMLMAEKEFRNGVISLGTYSNMCETAGNTEINFEEAINDFKTAYMLLEELAGYKFKSKRK